MELRFLMCEIVCAAGALVPIAGEWYYHRYHGSRKSPFCGPWLVSAGFALFAMQIDLMRRTLGRGPEHNAAVPWTLALLLAGILSLAFGVWDYSMSRRSVDGLRQP
jgi:hypothetical protein